MKSYNNLFIRNFYFVVIVISLISNKFLFADVEEIPDLFCNVNKKNVFEITEIITSSDDSFSGVSTYNVSLNTMASAKFGVGELSFLGSGRYNTYDNKFDLEPQKIFYSKKIDNNVIGFGVGYIFEESLYSKYSNYDYDPPGKYIEFHKLYRIQNIKENQFFGNLNSNILFETNKSLLFGVDFYYTTKRGFNYSEMYDYYSDYIGYSSDAVTWYNYDNNAYKCKVAFGAGLYKNFPLKEKKEKTSCTSLLWEFEKENSNPGYLEGVRSLFFNRQLDNIQYSGINNIHNEFRLESLISNDFQNSIPSTGSQSKIKFISDWTKLTVSLINDCNTTTSVNEWNRYDETYWGMTIRDFKKTLIKFSASNSSSIYALKFFYANLKMYSNVDVGIGSVNRDLLSIVQIDPYIGVKVIFKNILFDINYSPTDVNCSFYANKDDINLIYSLKLKPSIKLRILILK